MKNSFLAIGLFLLAVVLSGCVVGDLNIGLKDCGADITCFREAFKSCEPASIKQELLGFLMEGTITSEGDNCIYHTTLSNASTNNKMEERTCSFDKSKAEEISEFFEVTIISCPQIETKIQNN
jgi:hypothetical protein